MNAMNNVSDGSITQWLIKVTYVAKGKVLKWEGWYRDVCNCVREVIDSLKVMQYKMIRLRNVDTQVVSLGIYVIDCEYLTS